MTSDELQATVDQAHAFAIINAHLLKSVHQGLGHQTRDHDAIETIVFAADSPSVIEIKLTILVRPVKRRHELALAPLAETSEKKSV